jgi:hypothetical protein
VVFESSNVKHNNSAANKKEKKKEKKKSKIIPVTGLGDL